MGTKLAWSMWIQTTAEPTGTFKAGSSASYHELELSSGDEGRGPLPCHQEHLCNAINTTAKGETVLGTNQ